MKITKNAEAKSLFKTRIIPVKLDFKRENTTLKIYIKKQT
ncbi:hypothetical protein SAMN05443549_101847 [Flavobacterium fluvii]|uniref:Uncharacterized protein n=1 Tax=Flavobacterium fluvii TaxID=468056 RepID=A0A1M5FM73_9FLAO|nr:hypothetical protein SAMN05443549_101847 [Flavobacterium fluvii]